MTPKSITTNGPVVSCDVCGRTLLRGEEADVFFHGGARRTVCELCTQRAAHEGWIREGLDDATVRRRGAGGRSRSLLGRLRQRSADLVASVEGREPREPDEPGEAREPGPSGESREPRASREREREAAPIADPEAHAPRSVHAVPTNADLKMGRALDVFNVSRHARTVAGVSRSLGAPLVHVSPSTTEGSIVTVVVAWELSWYRFEIDLADEVAGPRVAAQGSELTELEPDEQLPNGAADELGQLHLVAHHA